MNNQSYWCKTCGQYVYGSLPHRCPPQWDVASCPVEDDETAQDSDIFAQVYAIDAELAASAAAERDPEYAPDLDDSVFYCVRKVGDTKWTRVRVSAQIEYTAEAQDDES